MISTEEFKDMIVTRTGLVYVSLIALVVLSGILVPGSVTRYSIPVTLRRTGILGMVAIGQTFVLLAGGTKTGVGLDLSVGALVFNTLVIGSTLLILGFSGITVVVICLIAGVAWGSLNGFVSTKLKVPPMVTTWTVSLILMGVARLLGNARPAPDFMRNIARGRLALGIVDIPYSFIALIVVTGLGYFLLQRTAYGRRIYAKSDNISAARVAGIKTDQLTFSIYIISSVLAVIAAFFAWGNQASPTMAFTDIYTFPSLAGAIIGGTGFGTGRGGVIGAVGGAFIMRFMFSILARLGADIAQQSILQGAILLAIVTVYALKR